MDLEEVVDGVYDLYFYFCRNGPNEFHTNTLRNCVLGGVTHEVYGSSLFALSNRVTPNERDDVENLLYETGVEGWARFRLYNGKPTLMIIFILQYGGVADVHRAIMKKLTQMFNATEILHELNEEIKKVDLLEMEGSYGYDTILEARD